jgi:hypothetical protein
MKKKKEKKLGEGRPVEDRERLYCPSCKMDYDVYSAGEGGNCPKCGGEPGVRGKDKAKAQKAVVRQKKAQKQKGKEGKKEKEAKKPPALKYSFDTLNKGQSLTIEDADKPAGKVTVRENARVLAFEYGKRNDMVFKVSPIKDGRCVVTRLK